ncbi:ICU11 [Symbiodinium natans]|uniref:ICU11 protein n=1 Tax=Symbiodinium natans TaxID=878477 RepID=A0A812PTP6_9DINO|nr:ICU11 [Symbiodinium natans]
MARRLATRTLLLLSCSQEGSLRILRASTEVCRGSLPPFSPAGSALEAARQLVGPKVTKKKDGEFEGGEFWEAHEELLKRAWQEHGPLHADLYSFGPNFERRYLTSKLRAAARLAREEGSEEAAKGLFEEILPGVFASEDLFTEAFRKDVLEELDRINSAGIPTRRPNGMNRYGVILDQVGFEEALNGLVGAYIKPLGGMLFPELVGDHDADEHYAFTVKYEPSGDTELAKHGDASVVTLNLCLGPATWKGGALRFFASGGSGIYALPKGNASAGSGDVNFQPGQVLLHRGQHKHQALPLLSGQRANLIIWLHAEHGVVRVAPYPPEQQLMAKQRWQQMPRLKLDL